MKILDNGGNAVDAAIAVSYALGVVQPYGSGIGGEGGMLVFPADGRDVVFYNYQGTAPLDGSIPRGYVAIPGFVLAMEKANTDYSTLPMNVLIEPSIQLAMKGFRIDSTLSKIISISKQKLSTNSKSVFYNNGALPGAGITLKQADLAITLKAIQSEGAMVFYNGTIAKDIAKAVKGLKLSDLQNYQVYEAKPIKAKYLNYEIISAPPPFGGVTLAQILMMSERLKINDFETSGSGIYEMAQIINAAYQDRSTNIGDPKFSNINVEELTSQTYIEKLIANAASNMNFVSTDTEDTTHFVVVDKDGMMVSCTNSLSSWFGSGILVDGFYLNNHLKNFSKDTNSINKWEAGKEPRTFISPTIVTLDGKPILGIGTPGGNAIPTVLAEVLINILENNIDPQVAIDKPRFYVRGNTVFYEGDMDKKIADELRKNGITVIKDPSSLDFGAVNCLYYDSKTSQLMGGADKRRGGTWSVK